MDRLEWAAPMPMTLTICETGAVKIFGDVAPQVVPPTLAYLDMNKWVELAQWRVAGDPAKDQKRFHTALEWATSGQVLFPLSSAHFFEIAKIGDDKRRRSLASAMADLSQGWFLVSPSNLINNELRRVMAHKFHRPVSIAPPCPITRSIALVFAERGQIDLTHEDRLFLQPGFLEEFLATARVDRPFLNNWSRIAEEHEHSRGVTWGGSKVQRKRAYCARLTIGISDAFGVSLSEVGMTSADLEKLGPDGCVQLLEGVPFFDIEVFLHVERNEHRDRGIQANDEIDIGFLRMAVPYCDYVITEKFWANLLCRGHFDKKYRTTIGSSLSAALACLAAQVSGNEETSLR